MKLNATNVITSRDSCIAGERVVTKSGGLKVQRARVKCFSGKFSSSACVLEFRIFKVLYGGMHFCKKLCCSCVKTNFDYGFMHPPRLADKQKTHLLF